MVEMTPEHLEAQVEMELQEAEEQNETNSLILVGHGGVMGVADGAPPPAT